MVWPGLTFLFWFENIKVEMRKKGNRTTHSRTLVPWFSIVWLIFIFSVFFSFLFRDFFRLFWIFSWCVPVTARTARDQPVWPFLWPLWRLGLIDPRRYTGRATDSAQTSQQSTGIYKFSRGRRGNALATSTGYAYAGRQPLPCQTKRFWICKGSGAISCKVLDKQSQLMNSPCGDPNKELNHKEENQ